MCLEGQRPRWEGGGGRVEVVPADPVGDLGEHGPPVEEVEDHHRHDHRHRRHRHHERQVDSCGMAAFIFRFVIYGSTIFNINFWCFVSVS